MTHPISSNSALAPRPDKAPRQDGLATRTATAGTPARDRAPGATAAPPAERLNAPRESAAPPARILAGTEEARTAIAELRQLLASDPVAARAAHGMPDRGATETMLTPTGF